MNNNLAEPVVNEVVNSGENVSSADPVADPVAPDTDPVIDIEPVVPVTDPVAPDTNPVVENVAPSITTKPASVKGTVGLEFVYDVNAIDPNDIASSMVYSLDVKPTGMTINSSTGVISWTPATQDTTNFAIVRVTDPGGLYDRQSFNVDVSGSQNAVPTAADDSVTTEKDVSVNINVLSNDTGLNDGSIQVSVISPTANGTTIVEADNTISYLPDAGFKGSDRFSYQVKDKDNDMATATVLINITCSGCPAPTSLTLGWNPNADQVDGYLVYFGTTATTTNNIVFDTANTMAEFDPVTDLSLQTGDTACFRLKAYTMAGESGFTDAVCTTI